MSRTVLIDAIRKLQFITRHIFMLILINQNKITKNKVLTVPVPDHSRP
jgi:hypothetical protein